MNVKLIADAGSTKVEWAVLSSDGSVEKRFVSDGINALLADHDHIRTILAGVRKESGSDCCFNKIHFYGAGCATSEICAGMSDILKEMFDCGDVSVESDLLAAARSLFLRGKGIACILGTGSNSCFYDGKKITANIPSLGYILGDEGSGASLGKRFVSDAFKGILPQILLENFKSRFNLSLADVLCRVYRTPEPNRFLASIVPFIKENIEVDAVRSLVKDEFRRFFQRNVARYPDAAKHIIGFIGSIALNFEDILRETASSEGMQIGEIIKAPMDGLISYHAL